MSQHRQLAAILFTDIVGYTAMMQRDEPHAVTAVKKHRSVLENTVSNYHGEIIEYFGDGSLCIFSSATEAVRCAVNLQRQMHEDPSVPLRIGIHISEVFFDEKRVMGDGVNLASRIQSMGQAGSILFSKEIADKIRNHHEFKTESLGFFTLKNVDQPMEIFALVGEGLTLPKREEMGDRWDPVQTKKQPGASKWTVALVIVLLATAIIYFYNRSHWRRFTGKDKSIAVLPFQNISNDSTQAYFSDGVTEEIITQLSKIADLRVISRTSVMPYKNTQKNVREIARELRVSSILEGSVRREGDNIRITAQLIDAGTDQHIWSKNYDRMAREIFAIQSDVAQQIAREMNATLTAEESKRIEKKATKNVAAYEEYLRAKQSPLNEAERLLLSALKKDSTFALAWAQLAYVYTKMPDRNPTDGPFYIRKSLDAALTAVEYGPDLSEAHMMLGDVLKTITLNPALSIRELNKAIALNPSNADAYVFLAYAQIELGQFGEAELNLVKAGQLAPATVFVKFAWMRFFIFSRNAEKLTTLKKEMEQLGQTTENYLQTLCYFLRDHYDSILLYTRGKFIDPALQGVAYARTGQAAQAEKIIDSLKAKSESAHPFTIAIIYAWLGQKQKAIKYLRLAYELYDYRLISIRVDKLFDPLRNEAEFKELLQKMGM